MLTKKKTDDIESIETERNSDIQTEMDRMIPWANRFQPRDRIGTEAAVEIGGVKKVFDEDKKKKDNDRETCMDMIKDIGGLYINNRQCELFNA